MIKQIKILIQSNKIAIFFTMLFFYAIIYVVIEDVIQAEEYHFPMRILGYVLLFSILLYFFIGQAFKGHLKRLKNMQIIVLLLSAVFLAYGVNFMIKERIEKKVHDSKTFLNPLYPKYEKIAKEYHLDLSFTKITKEQRGPVNYKINTIYSEKPKSIDILFIGDSSIAWGVIPEVIEQLSNKKVAIFAYESNSLTEKTAALFNRISKYYLKDNGILVVSFDNNFYAKNPDSILISKKEYTEITSLNDEQFIHFIKKMKSEIVHPFVLNHSTSSMLNMESNMTKSVEDKSLYKRYQEKYNNFSKYLAEIYHLRLKSIEFYTLYLEEYINPKWNKNKNVNIKNDTTMFLRWNMNTITQYDPNFDQYSIYSESLPEKKLNDKNIERNAIAASKIYGLRKIFMVPVFDENKHYALSRNIYKTYYKKHGFELFDLGLYHPKTKHYPMQGGSHMGNEGGLMKSIFIGQWLKEHLEY